MKKSLLVLGGLLILINTSAGIVFSAYKPVNMIFTDISILLSIGVMYGTVNSPMADGFKIGLSFFFALTGLCRMVCSVLSPEQFKDNTYIFIFIFLLAIEILCLFVGNMLKSKN